MTLDEIVARLASPRFDLDARQVLDALWLATRGRELSLRATRAELPAPVGSPEKPPVEPTADGAPAKDASAASEPPASASTSGVPAADPVPAPSTTPVYARGDATGAERTIKASPVAVPASRALPQRLALMRALRPLCRRWPSRQYPVLDEDGTVDASARLRHALPGLVMPVFRPRLERWFDVELVLEDDASIELWADALREFAQMLRDTGAFGRVRAWRLRMPAGTGQRPMLENAIRLRVPTAHLLGSGTRRLVIFASNGASARWLDGSYAGVLAPWLRDDAVLLLQLAAPARWSRTRLGEAHALASTAEPGAAAAALKVDVHWWRVAFDPETPGLLPLPVVPLQPKALGDWAQMQMARGRRSPAYLIAPPQPARTSRPDTAAAPPRSVPLDIPRALAQLRDDAPEAFRLGVFLCTAPFTLPVARLVQAIKFDGSTDPGLLAELLQSGLVTAGPSARGGESTQHATPDATYYDVRPEARALLLRSLRDSDAAGIARELQRQVSQHLADIAGSGVRSSQLVADDEGSHDLPDWARPFAQVATSLLGLPATPQSAADRVHAFERDAAPALAGSAARLAASGLAPDPTLLDAATWQTLVEARLVHQRGEREWVFAPHVRQALAALDARRPLLGRAVLWVDDHPDNNRNEAAAMRLAGATIATATDTSEALAMERAGAFDVLITDMRRGQDRRAGMELLRTLRWSDRTLPVIVYAPIFTDGLTQAALGAGALGYTNQADELHELVRQAVAATATPVIRSSDPAPGSGAATVSTSATLARTMFAKGLTVLAAQQLSSAVKRLIWSPDGPLAVMHGHAVDVLEPVTLAVRSRPRERPHAVTWYAHPDDVPALAALAQDCELEAERQSGQAFRFVVTPLLQEMANLLRLRHLTEALPDTLPTESPTPAPFTEASRPSTSDTRCIALTPRLLVMDRKPKLSMAEIAEMFASAKNSYGWIGLPLADVWAPVTDPRLQPWIDVASGSIVARQAAVRRLVDRVLAQGRTARGQIAGAGWRRVGGATQLHLIRRPDAPRDPFRMSIDGAQDARPFDSPIVISDFDIGEHGAMAVGAMDGALFGWDPDAPNARAERQGAERVVKGLRVARWAPFAAVAWVRNNGDCGLLNPAPHRVGHE